MFLIFKLGLSVDFIWLIVWSNLLSFFKVKNLYCNGIIMLLVVVNVFIVSMLSEGG